jgi:hypothetical protein
MGAESSAARGRSGKLREGAARRMRDPRAFNLISNSAELRRRQKRDRSIGAVLEGSDVDAGDIGLALIDGRMPPKRTRLPGFSALPSPRRGRRCARGARFLPSGSRHRPWRRRSRLCAALSSGAREGRRRYIGDGSTRWPACLVSSAVSMLALEQGVKNGPITRRR